MNNRSPKEGGKDLNGSVVFCSSMGGRAYCLSLDPRIGGEGGGVRRSCPRANLYIA